MKKSAGRWQVISQSFSLFCSAAIAMTLGMPRLPESWSNSQVLGFIRYMWQQWLLKSGRGRTDAGDDVRGPAPPSAVAAAAKIAFSSLGASTAHLFQPEEHEKSPAEQPPMDKPGVALLERTQSGTLGVPLFTVSEDDDLSDWTDEKEDQIHESTAFPSSPSSIRTALDDPERRNKNLQWLRHHFRSLGDVGRLPFNNADLWQLHQYYFSPPYPGVNEDGVKETTPTDTPDEETSAKMDMSNSRAVPALPRVDSKNPSIVSRTVSFQTLGDAFAASDAVSLGTAASNKRRSDEEDSKPPAAKRAKSLKTRIGYYPRIMVRTMKNRFDVKYETGLTLVSITG